MHQYASAPNHEPGNDARQQRILDEFRKGYDLIETLGKAITYFGSAVIDERNQWYQEARTLARFMAEDGFAAVTGAGPGIMEAANRGAVEAGERSIGLSIELEQEQKNEYATEVVNFYYLFVRKVMLASAGHAYVFFPGGFGTLDEFFEISTLVRTHKLHQDVPIVLVGKAYWQPILTWLEDVVLNEFHAFNKADMTMWYLADSAEEARDILRRCKFPLRLYY